MKKETEKRKNKKKKETNIPKHNNPEKKNEK